MSRARDCRNGIGARLESTAIIEPVYSDRERQKRLLQRTKQSQPVRFGHHGLGHMVRQFRFIGATSSRSES